jgi:cell division protein FtsB
VAGRTTDGATRRRRPYRSKRAGRRRLRLLWLAGVLAISVYLYYRPLTSYFETRSNLEETRAQVESLREAKARLEQRLAFSTSEEATRREARRIGYVRPGEQLYVVKGIPAWRRAHVRTLRGNG